RAVDDKVARLLRLAERVGALGRERPAPPPMAPPETAALLREAAATGMTLVANPRRVLPLAAERLSRVAVIGPHAAQARTQGGGSAEVHPAYTVSPLDGLREALAGRAEVTYRPGVRLAEGLVPVAAPVATNPATGEPGVRVDLLAADGTVLRTDRRLGGSLRYTTSGDLVPGTTRLRAAQAGGWRIGFGGIGRFTLRLGGELALEGGVDPADLDMTSAWADPPEHSLRRDLAEGQEVELALEYQVAPDLPASVCLLGYERPEPDADAELAAAVAAARDADVAVVVVGTTERVESEGFDRRSLALPDGQDALVDAVAAA